MKSPVICLAGSMKQKSQMDEIARDLTWKGCVVLAPVDMNITQKELKKYKLDNMIEFFRALQYQRILLADLVIAIPKQDDSFGKDTKMEVDFANKYGRVVLKISKLEEIDSEEIKLAMMKSKKNTIIDLSTILIESLHIMEAIGPEAQTSWQESIRAVVKEVDEKLFPGFNVARDTITNILRDANV